MCIIDKEMDDKTLIKVQIIDYFDEIKEMGTEEIERWIQDKQSHEVTDNERLIVAISKKRPIDFATTLYLSLGLKDLQMISTGPFTYDKIIYPPFTLLYSCAICLESRGFREYYLQLKCKHSFHQKCIVKWFKRSVSCPICRVCCFDIDQIEYSMEYENDDIDCFLQL